MNQPAVTNPVVANEFSPEAESFQMTPAESTWNADPPTTNVEDLTDEEFNELFGRPGVAVKQELKQLLKQRVVCQGCGQFDCTGCFGPGPAPSQRPPQFIESDFFQTLTAPPAIQPVEPQPFVPFDDNMGGLAGKVIPVAHQEIVETSPESGSAQFFPSWPNPNGMEFRLHCYPEFCTEINGFGQFKRFPDRIFSATQRVLVYCEVENHESVTVQATDGQKFLTRLRGRFAIVDRNGNGCPAR